MVLGLQSYADTLPGKVILEANISFGTSTMSIVTDNTWQTFDATPYYNPKGNTGGAYQCPQEHIVASLFPGEWTLAGYNAAAWVPATESAPFGFELTPKVSISHPLQCLFCHHTLLQRFAPGNTAIEHHDRRGSSCDSARIQFDVLFRLQN